jgi:L-aspartate oxidase
VDETQRVAWEKCGIVRDGKGLSEACERLARPAQPEGSEARNMREVALLIARCALAREESRGAHFRTDYPGKRAEFAKHSVVSKDAEIVFR